MDPIQALRAELRSFMAETGDRLRRLESATRVASHPGVEKTEVAEADDDNALGDFMAQTEVRLAKLEAAPRVESQPDTAREPAADTSRDGFGTRGAKPKS